MKSRRSLPFTLSALLACFAGTLLAVDVQKSPQPRVTPGPSEPDWVAILDALYGLRMIDDLANPVLSTVEKVPSLFRKAGEGPVTYRPVIALGLETPTRGGWYLASDNQAAPEKLSLWSYQFKNSGQRHRNRREPATSRPGRLDLQLRSRRRNPSGSGSRTTSSTTAAPSPNPQESKPTTLA